MTSPVASLSPDDREANSYKGFTYQQLGPASKPVLEIFTELQSVKVCRNTILILGTNLVLGPPEKFYRRNPSETFRDVHWYHLDGPKKVPGAPSQGFLIFLGFHKNVTKIENWLSHPHFLADF